MVLDIRTESIPFLFDLHPSDSGAVLVIHNGEESIRITGIQQQGDSLSFRMPLFDSEFRGALLNDSTWSGTWFNYQKGADYQVPFVAHAGTTARFPGRTGSAPIAGSWRVRFNEGSNEACDAIGVFNPKGDAVQGTFLTETGDYRFLDGALIGDSLMLSCFDGSHAFLFKARFRNDTLHGRFWSGTHWEEPWVAYRDPTFRLRHPDSLTYLQEGHKMVDFRFPNISGGSVSPKDPQYAGKVLLVQVMGSWCPNCVDETRLLNEMYAEHHDEGLEVIAVAFEKYSDTTRAMSALHRFREALSVPYAIAYAGMANKKESAAKLPFLNHVMSFPTCIFVDRSGMVRRIRTGFYGPGTGEHHLAYRKDLNTFLLDLLQERPSLAAH